MAKARLREVKQEGEGKNAVIQRWQFLLLTVIGAAAICLAILNGILFVSNRSLQTTVSNRQQFVLQSVQLETLYREMIKTLADLSARNNDEELRNLLKNHGITFTVNPPAPPSAPKGSKK